MFTWYCLYPSRSLVIRDMIVRCMAQMVSSRATNIKSGWKNIFAVSPWRRLIGDEKLVDMAFQTTSELVICVRMSTYRHTETDRQTDRHMHARTQSKAKQTRKTKHDLTLYVFHAVVLTGSSLCVSAIIFESTFLNR